MNDCAVCQIVTLRAVVSTEWLVAASIAAGIAIAEARGGLAANTCDSHRALVEGRLPDAREAAAAPANDQRGRA